MSVLGAIAVGWLALAVIVTLAWHAAHATAARQAAGVRLSVLDEQLLGHGEDTRR